MRFISFFLDCDDSDQPEIYIEDILDSSAR
jgi:hypothetical protein